MYEKSESLDLNNVIFKRLETLNPIERLTKIFMCKPASQLKLNLRNLYVMPTILK